MRQLVGIISPPVEKDNASELEFANGSRIVSLPGENEDTIRGYSAASEIIVDEAGDVKEDIFDAILPMLTVSKGTLVCAGTPKGQRGRFYEWWVSGDEFYERIEVTWRACPRIDPKEIPRYQAELGEKFAQEYECQFLRLSGGMVYPAFTANTNVIGGLPESPDWTYLLSIDFGYVDATAFVLCGWIPHDKTLYIIHSYQKSGMNADAIAEYVKNLSTRWTFQQIVGDISGYGKGPAVELGSRYGIHVEPAPKTDKVGFISLLNAGFAQSQVKILGSNVELVEELIRLPWNSARSDVMPGYTDHLSDALLYGYRVALAYLEKPAEKKPETEPDRIKQEMKEYWERAKNQHEAEQYQAERQDLFDSMLGPEGFDLRE